MKTLFAALVVVSLTASVQVAHAAYTPQEPPAASEPESPPAVQEPQAPAVQEEQAPAVQEAQAPAVQEAQAPAAPIRTVKVELQRITKMIYAKDYRKAQLDLRSLNREFQNDADINNLLGFTNRKLKLFSSSAYFYRVALKLEPNHLDALAYQGELFIATKKVPLAKRNLAKLKTLCGVQCSQYKDLRKAIGRR